MQKNKDVLGEILPARWFRDLHWNHHCFTILEPLGTLWPKKAHMLLSGLLHFLHDLSRSPKASNSSWWPGVLSQTMLAPPPFINPRSVPNHKLATPRDGENVLSACWQHKFSPLHTSELVEPRHKVNPLTDGLLMQEIPVEAINSLFFERGIGLKWNGLPVDVHKPRDFASVHRRTSYINTWHLPGYAKKTIQNTREFIFSASKSYPAS